MLTNAADEDMETALEWSLLESIDEFTILKIHYEDDANSFAPLVDELLLTVTFLGVDLF